MVKLDLVHPSDKKFIDPDDGASDLKALDIFLDDDLGVMGKREI